MKYLQKISYIILSIFALSLMISANDVNTYIYEYPEQEITIQFSESTSFSNDTRKIIADSIVYDITPSQTYSLCWLLGHDTTVETVTAVYHEVSEYDPRCQLEVYDVTRCSNCDYIYPVLAYSKYISCCPPEASAVSLD